MAQKNIIDLLAILQKNVDRMIFHYICRISNEDNSDKSSNATQSNLAYQNVNIILLNPGSFVE